MHVGRRIKHDLKMALSDSKVNACSLLPLSFNWQCIFESFKCIFFLITKVIHKCGGQNSKDAFPPQDSHHWLFNQT